MQPKPENFGAIYAETFKDQRVVDSYRFRPPYPDEVFDKLARLISDEPCHVLDVGAGSGDIARHMLNFAARVDAVDFSLSMLERGKKLPMPWNAELRRLRAQFSKHTGHRSAHVVEELEQRSFLRRLGDRETAPVPFTQTIDEFIQGLHSRSSFASELMGQQRAADFDRLVRSLLFQYHSDGILPLQVVGTVTWGLPGSGATR